MLGLSQQVYSLVFFCKSCLSLVVVYVCCLCLVPVNKHACSTCSTNFHNYSGIFNWCCTICGVGGSVVRKFSLKWVLHITREITIYQCERANNWGTFWRHRPETCLSFGHWFNPNPLLRYISVHSFLWMIIKYHKVDYNLPVWTCPAWNMFELLVIGRALGFNPNPSLLRYMYISVQSFLWMSITYHMVHSDIPVWTCP